MTCPVQAYDVVPYVSYPYAQSHPAHLMTLGRLFGLEAPDFRTARVLELGCASGWNILPFAADYPEAQVVGIDLSAVQIDEGRRHATALNLANLRLDCASIQDIGDDLGTFDYIICHGVLSWVPEDVRGHIFRVLKRNLSPRGVAYVSYNTLPGWNQVRSVRDMMLYHTRMFANPAEKAEQAAAILKFAADNVGPENKAYGNILKQEMAALEGQPLAYFLHDHLEVENHQYYFHQFAERAAESGLGYLGDAVLRSMHTGNLSPQVAHALGGVNDIIRVEQYMDFVVNRRFRSSLLCHSDAVLDRAIGPEKLASLLFRSHLVPRMPAAGLDLDRPVTFDGPQTLIADNPIDTATLLILHEQRAKPISLDTLVELVKKRLKTKDGRKIRQAFLGNLTQLVLSGCLTIHAAAGRHVNEVSAKPTASPLARYQAAFTERVINGRHEVITLDPIARILVGYLDGQNDLTAICNRMMAHVEAGAITVTPADGAVADAALHRREVEANVHRLLNAFRELALLYA